VNLFKNVNPEKYIGKIFHQNGVIYNHTKPVITVPLQALSSYLSLEY